MSLDKKCIKRGLDGWRELSKLSDYPRSTLYKYEKERPKRLECLILGAAVKKERQK